MESYSRTVFGFWVYLMTDALLFATLFATYAVLHTGTFGGPSAKEIFELPSAFYQTMLLLFSSFAAGFATLSAYKNQKRKLLFWLSIAFLLGAGFIILELREFAALIHQGYSWKKSAFLSSYFTLVGTHGLHITVGLFWMLVVGCQLIFQPFSVALLRRVTTLSLYWHFLDVIWIFIFTIVYLMGVAK